MRAALFALLLMACNSNSGPVQQPPSADWSGGPHTFSVSERQLADLITVARFGDAYNGGRVEEAMALLGVDFGGSDCDYRHAASVSFSGREQARAWLRQRAADHDRLEIRQILNVNPDQPVGVTGIEWARRTSDTLRKLGFGGGIVPQLAAKVVLDRSGGVRAFANGLEGGSASACRPSASVASGPSAQPPLPLQFDLSPRPYTVGSRWLSPLKTLATFEDAYAAGNLDAAPVVLAPDLVMNDRDYTTGQVVDVHGKEGAARLLQAKVADRDRRQVGRVYNESGQPGVVGVVWTGRVSDSLRSRGFASGIRQQLPAKVVFTEGGLIRTFANAGSSGLATECRPARDQSL